MTGWPILSVITFLPLIGALFIFAIRGEDEIAIRNARFVALWTTIITFLLVALLQNSQTRNDNATQHKLNAVADALADLMSHMADRYDDEALRHDIRELRAAVGLEAYESTTES